jgi:serine/threonine protein kinase
MALNLDAYHVKTYTPEVYERGIGLFSTETYNVQPGLNHMFRCLDLLYNSPARDYIEFPLSIRTPGNKDEHYEIIYRLLSDYRCGTPNRIEDEELYQSFVQELKRIIELVHEAGVIHVDLYASNVMWKQENGKVLIKIIDWDAAHCLEEGDFNSNIRGILEDRYPGKVEFGAAHDDLYLAVYEIPYSSDFEAVWHNLGSGEKIKIDEAYTQLMAYNLEIRGVA